MEVRIDIAQAISPGKRQEPYHEFRLVSAKQIAKLDPWE
jgi:hypothetical protein